MCVPFVDVQLCGSFGYVYMNDSSTCMVNEPIKLAAVAYICVIISNLFGACDDLFLVSHCNFWEKKFFKFILKHFKWIQKLLLKKSNVRAHVLCFNYKIISICCSLRRIKKKKKIRHKMCDVTITRNEYIWIGNRVNRAHLAIHTQTHVVEPRAPVAIECVN